MAYSKGYNDGLNNLAFDPISDAPAASGSSSGSGFGLGKLLNMVMAGSMVYQMGGTPFSLESLVANLKQMQPMQMMILFSCVSGLFS